MGKVQKPSKSVYCQLALSRTGSKLLNIEIGDLIMTIQEVLLDNRVLFSKVG
jgi:hypothetical protein